MGRFFCVQAALLTLFALAAAGSEEPRSVIVRPPEEPWLATRERAERSFLRRGFIARLQEGVAEPEGCMGRLANIVADASEEPGLRNAAADLLGRVTVEVTVAGVKEKQPRALACALTEAALDGDPGGWTAGYLAEVSRRKGGAQQASLLVRLMADERLAEFHRSLALDGRLSPAVRETAVGVIGSLEGVWAYETLSAFAADEALDDGLRVAAVAALAPIGYDRGRALLEGLARRDISPRLREAVVKGLETIERVRSMSAGAWVMFAVGIALLFGGSALFISIALKRGKRHIFSDEPDGGPENG